MATRLVDKNGKFSWKQQKVFVSGSLAGWEVGLQGTEKGQLQVWFGGLLLGHRNPLEPVSCGPKSVGQRFAMEI